ncbi:MAG: hypothetical protein JW863_06870 [Chitinispirillaceae bacterium]|nr:hypothetical protein [Chitinispirillaceae bacterium]
MIRWYIAVIMVTGIFCGNPQISDESSNNDPRFVGKWIELNTDKTYHFKPDGTYDFVDSNQIQFVYGFYAQEYRTYLDRYVNLVLPFSQITFLGSLKQDTTVLFDHYRQYRFSGDTLFLERICFLFNGMSASLVGKWTHIPMKQYIVNNTYTYNDSGSKYMHFGNDGLLDTDFDWYQDTIPPPYPYVDHSVFFTLHGSIGDTHFVNLDYVIHDSLLVMFWPPYEPDSTAAFSIDTLLRAR